MHYADHTEFFNALQEQLAIPLPGEAAQNRMTSRTRISTAAYLEKNPNHKSSAVLLMLYPFENTIHTLLIRRPTYNGMHSGQLALPGGKVEKEDESLMHTALRETEEEVGIRISPVDVIGKLTPVYIPVSNYLVQPFVAKLQQRPDPKPDPSEVAGILEISLAEMMREESKTRKRITIGENMFIDAPCYIVNGEILWGATAMMFAELEEILRRVPNNP